MVLTHGNVIFDILEPSAFQNIAYVGSFEHFSGQLFATRPRPALTAVHRWFDMLRVDQQNTIFSGVMDMKERKTLKLWKTKEIIHIHIKSESSQGKYESNEKMYSRIVLHRRVQIFSNKSQNSIQGCFHFSMINVKCWRYQPTLQLCLGWAP